MTEAEAALATLPPLIALRAISNGALQGAALPTRIKILNWGTNETTQGPVIVDDASIAHLAANQRALGYDRVALDFQHNTVPGSPEYERTKEPRQVAGYGTPEIVKGDGLYMANVQWTPAGLAEAKNYADLSPTPSLDAGRRVQFLHSVALVRNGSVFDLSFFSTSDPRPKTQDPIMTPEQIASAISTAVAAALKPATEQLTTLAADVKTLKEAKPAIATYEVKVGDKTITLDAAALASKVVTLEATIATQAQATTAAEKAAVINRFSIEGKAPLGEDGKALDTAALETFSVPELKRLLANTPATVPLSARTTRPKDGKGTDGLTGIARAIAAHQTETAAR